VFIDFIASSKFCLVSSAFFKFLKKMERMLLFSFSIEKNKLAGLVNINQNRHRNAIQDRKEVKA